MIREDKTTRWEVSKEDTREHSGHPHAGTHCLYCDAPLGGRHKNECVVPTRQVELTVVLTISEPFPVSFTTETIEFSLNEGSQCADFLMETLQKIIEQRGCLCRDVKFYYAGETKDVALSPTIQGINQ